MDCALGYRAASASDPGFAKGEAHFQALEQRFGLPRASFLFTGDSPNDAHIAAAAGVRFRALLTDAFSQEDFERAVPGTRTLASLEELGDHIATVGASVAVI